MKMFRWFFSFYGRLGRANYWKVLIAGCAIYLAAGVSLNFFFPEQFFGAKRISDQGPLLACITFLFIVIFSAVVRRLHDIGRSGWWSPVLVLVAPFICSAVVAYFSGPTVPRLVIYSAFFILALVFVGSISGNEMENRVSLTSRSENQSLKSFLIGFHCMRKPVCYLLAVGSIALAIWVIHEGMISHPRPVWPLYVLPPAFILNAVMLVTSAPSGSGRIGRLVRLWLDVKEADLRERLGHTKSSGRMD
jgi:uncharacterized membrane protein YhaH (DUF805 family)